MSAPNTDNRAAIRRRLAIRLFLVTTGSFLVLVVVMAAFPQVFAKPFAGITLAMWAAFFELVLVLAATGIFVRKVNRLQSKANLPQSKANLPQSKANLLQSKDSAGDAL